MVKIHVLFVCLGNICRSPLAEHLFKRHIENKKLSRFFHIESCGTGGWHKGENADSRTRKNAQKNGLVFTHSARQLSPQDQDDFDYILAMDNQNLKDIKILFKNHKNLSLLTEYSDSHFQQPIPDPYYGNESDFDHVFHLLNFTTNELANKLEQLYQLK